MLVDEVLSVGDEHFKKKSMARMEELIGDKNRTVLIVSHTIETLQKLCDRILWMNDGLVTEIGGTEQVLKRYRQHMNY